MPIVVSSARSLTNSSTHGEHPHFWGLKQAGAWQAAFRATSTYPGAFQNTGCLVLNLPASTLTTACHATCCHCTV